MAFRADEVRARAVLFRAAVFLAVALFGATAGFADDIALAAVVSALAAVVMALVAVFIA